MPRIHALHIILEYNLKPPLVVPSRNKSAIDRNRIGGMNWEFVELVHAWAIGKLIGKLQWGLWGDVGDIVDCVTRSAVNSSYRTFKNESLW